MCSIFLVTIMLVNCRWVLEYCIVKNNKRAYNAQGFSLLGGKI